MGGPPKWDSDLKGMGGRSYKSSQDILDEIRDTGKLSIPSNDFIFPPEINELRNNQAINPKHTGSMEAVSNATWDIAQEYEPRSYQALSEGIRQNYGFTPKHRTTDITKELASQMGVPTPKLEYKYTPGVVGRTNSVDLIQLNPKLLGEMGREATIAHELRHIKEGPGSSGSTLGKSREGLEGIIDSLSLEGQLKSKQGKDLQQFSGKGKFKSEIDALDILNFFEGKHFKNSYIKENLKRVAKKLPIIGQAAAIGGALSYADPASAAVDMVMPGGLEEIGQNDAEVMSDRQYRQANLIPNAGMLGDYSTSPDSGQYYKKVRQLSQRKP